MAEGPQLVARTADGLWELKGGKFVPRPFKHGTPRSAAFFGGALWVTDAKGLYRLTAAANDTDRGPLRRRPAAPAAGPAPALGARRRLGPGPLRTWSGWS